MPLFDIPKSSKKQETTSNIKLKKGQTISGLVREAEELVLQKLGKYKDTSKCVTNINELKQFFNNTADDGIIGIDTETTRFEYFSGSYCRFLCM